MPSDNGPPKYFFEGVELTITGLPAFRNSLENARRAYREEKLEPILKSLSVLYSMLEDFFNDFKPGEDTGDRKARELNVR